MGWPFSGPNLAIKKSNDESLMPINGAIPTVDKPIPLYNPKKPYSDTIIYAYFTMVILVFDSIFTVKYVFTKSIGYTKN